MQKTIKIISLVFIALWILAIFLSILPLATYTPSENEDKLGVAFTRGIYAFFIIASILGALSAVEFSVAIHEFFAYPKSLANKITLGLSILTNVLLYTSVVLLFIPNGEVILIFLAAWVISGFACFISMLLH